VVKLDKAGVAASTGSACASGKEKVSHVLDAMGLAAEEASGVVRYSSARETTGEEWEKLAAIVEQVWAEMKVP
jgi:cysteine desulfurase